MEIDDFKNFKTEIKTWIEGASIRQTIIDDWSTKYQQRILDTSEEQIRKALIDLGWTAPKDNNYL